MNKKCPNCGFVFEREEGYFTSSMAINLVISEVLVAAFVVPMSANLSIPLYVTFAIGAPLPFLLPLLFYHHSRSLFMSVDHYFNPVQREPTE
jgi:uncharacterized protein (DUF983 family)